MVSNNLLIDNYIKLRDKNMLKVLETLRKAFTKYYGEENKGKIDSVIEDLIIVYVGTNIKQNELDNKIAEADSVLKNSIHSMIIKSNHKVTVENLIDYALNDENPMTFKKQKLKEELLTYIYYLYLQKRKINETDLSVILDLNKGSLSEQLSLIGRSLGTATAGGAYPYTNHSSLMYLKMKKGKISLHTLIHETNHLLQKEDIAFIEEKSGTKKLGISGMTERSDVLVDETINDYISKDVLDIFLTLYDGDLTMLDPTFHGGYLVIDSVCDNIGFRTYSLLKEDIKNNFINGNARKIKKIINFSNRYNYSSYK